MNRKTVLCFGDSNTYGFDPVNWTRYEEDVRWPGVLAKLLGEDYKVIEEGCNGRTTRQDDPDEDWTNGRSYLKPCLYSHRKIDIMILMLGTNDLKNRFHLTAEEIADGIEELITVTKEFITPKQEIAPEILLIAPPVVADSVNESRFNDEFDETAIQRSKQFAKLYSDVAKRQGCMLLDASKFVESCKEDAIHLMPDMHRKLGEAVFEMIS